jgi:AsmA protein
MTKKILIKSLKIVLISFISLVALLFLAPFLFPQRISDEIKKLATNSLTTPVNFSKARLSFFNHFPSLTLTLYDFDLKGSAPYANTTLVKAKEVALGINIASLLSKKIDIDEIYLTEAAINIQVDAEGKPNYNVYKSGKVDTTTVKDSSSASLKIEKIVVEKSSVTYDDRSLPMYINAVGFEYKGKGDLSKAIFDLTTHAEVAAVDFMYGGRQYFVSKKLQADLITKINTNSLAFVFEKNDLKINKLPFDFTGKFEFLKDGYNMLFKLNSNATDLHDIFTALPPEYITWLDKTEVKGTGDISAELAGKFIASTNTMPDLKLNIGVRNGYIANNKTPSPVKNLFLNFETKLPGLNPDSLYVNIDSIFFNIDKDYFSSVVQIKGMKQPYIKAKINSEIDLDKWDKAFGITKFDVKGLLKLHATAEGNYTTATVKHLRSIDTVISSIPNFKVESSLINGYFKQASVAEPITNIAFNLDASCSDNKYQHTKLSIANMNANVLSNYIKGFFKLSGGDNYPIEANIKSKFNLADVKQFYALDSIELKGNLLIDVLSSGTYNLAKKAFPKTTAAISLVNGSVKTKYYPSPIEKINIEATVANNDGTLKGTSINIKPASLEFEKQPFTVKASIENLSDIKYDITSNGILDIGRIYKVFALDGIGVNGSIETHVSLQGKQSDAMHGLYDRLRNSGTMKVNNVALTYERFPQPLLVKSGLFRFQQENMWFDQFNASYGRTDFSLSGKLQNVINYVMQSKSLLKGDFTFNSNKMYIDELMAFAPVKGDTSAKKSASTGVIMIPDNLDVTLTASANKVMYNGLQLDSARGNLTISSGKLMLKETGFNIIGAAAVMDATYVSQSATKAYFDFHITAKDFDVNKAYRQIALFHNMASSAKYLKGIVSVDYALKGKLDDNMMPIYPSLEGGGVLSVQNVQVKGLKLFTAVSKATNRDSLNNPNLKKVDFKTTIKNNIITLERTKMRIFGFRPRMEGQVSLDGRLNLKMRIGLPPLGIFGIPVSITGTQANPKVALRRGKDADNLQETPDSTQN